MTPPSGNNQQIKDKNVGQAIVRKIVEDYKQQMKQQPERQQPERWPDQLPVPVPNEQPDPLVLFSWGQPAKPLSDDVSSTSQLPLPPYSLQGLVNERAQFRADQLQMMAPIGLVDIPEKQSQEVCWIDLHGARGGLSGGPLLVAGMQDSGKATLLQTILLWFAARYSARQLRIAIIDPAQDLQVFEALPHLRDDEGKASWTDGEVIEDIKSLVAYCDRQIKNRRQQFSGVRWDAATVSTLQEKGVELPFFLLVLHQFHTLSAVTILKDLALRFIKERNLGLYLILSTAETSIRFLPSDILAKVGTRVGLYMSDSGRQELSLRAPVVPDLIPGRGLVMTRGGLAHELQTALPLPGETEAQRFELLKREVDWLAQVGG